MLADKRLVTPLSPSHGVDYGLANNKYSIDRLIYERLGDGSACNTVVVPLSIQVRCPKLKKGWEVYRGKTHFFSQWRASTETRPLNLDSPEVTFHPWRFSSLGCHTRKLAGVSMLELGSTAPPKSFVHQWQSCTCQYLTSNPHGNMAPICQICFTMLLYSWSMLHRFKAEYGSRAARHAF